MDSANATSNTSSSFHWPPLESNPEIFEAYMGKIGLPTESWGFSELLGFDEDLLELIPQPVLAVIANFEPVNPEKEKERGSAENYVETHQVVDYYMKQTGKLDNACGVIACLHAIYNNISNNNNNKIICLDPNKLLAQYYNLVQDKTPQERSICLEENKEFQRQHQTFATQGQSVMPQTQEGVKYHYVAYVINSKQQLVELNGTRRGPHIVAEKCDDVLRGSVAEIQRRLSIGEILPSLSMMTLNAKVSLIT